MSIEALCAAAGMRRQNYYKRHQRRQRQQIDEGLVLSLVRGERKRHPRLGGRKLWHLVAGELERAGVELGRDRFFEVLRKHDLLIFRKSGGCRTTDSGHGFRTYVNLARALVLRGPHQLLVADITYLRTLEGFVYLALVMDAFSRKIVGYDCSSSLEAEGARRALKQAIRQLPAGAGAVHHSDRGIQYCCREYVELAEGSGLLMSMTEDRHCYENAQAERLNGVLKQEYGLGQTLQSLTVARELVREAVGLYNDHRPHGALGYRVPSEVHDVSGPAEDRSAA